MTLLGTVMQVGFSFVFTLGPAAVLMKDRLQITIVLCFVAILASFVAGGLILAVPVTVFLVLFSFWVRFVGKAEAGVKRILFIITMVLSAIFLAQHVVHLPIRFALDQPAVKIASNVAGIFLAAAMLSATLELLIIKRRKNRGLKATSNADII